MLFHLSEEHLAVRDAAREFAQKELKPGVIERDSTMAFPKDQVRRMTELGFLGMMAPPQYGGGGMDTLSYVLAIEEISKVDNSCSVIMSVNNSLHFPIRFFLSLWSNCNRSGRIVKRYCIGLVKYL